MKVFCIYVIDKIKKIWSISFRLFPAWAPFIVTKYALVNQFNLQIRSIVFEWLFTKIIAIIIRNEIFIQINSIFCWHKNTIKIEICSFIYFMLSVHRRICFEAWKKTQHTFTPPPPKKNCFKIGYICTKVLSLPCFTMYLPKIRKFLCLFFCNSM